MTYRFLTHVYAAVLVPLHRLREHIQPSVVAVEYEVDILHGRCPRLSHQPAELQAHERIEVAPVVLQQSPVLVGVGGAAAKHVALLLQFNLERFLVHRAARVAAELDGHAALLGHIVAAVEDSIALGRQNDNAAGYASWRSLCRTDTALRGIDNICCGFLTADSLDNDYRKA